MEYEEFDKRFGEIFYIFQIVVDFLIKKPVPVSDFRDELKKYVGSLDIVENFIKKYQERNIIEFQYNYDKKMTLVGLTKEYREKLRKQEYFFILIPTPTNKMIPKECITCRHSEVCEMSEGPHFTCTAWRADTSDAECL